MKKLPIIGIVSAIQGGIPLAKEVINLFKKGKQKTDVNELSSMDNKSLIDKINQLESDSANESTLIAKLTQLIITGATVYFVIWISAKFGITRQDVIDLFGLIK